MPQDRIINIYWGNETIDRSSNLSQVRRSMNHRLLVLATVALLALLPSARAQDREDSGKKHHKIWEWLNAISGEEREKLRAAKKQAMRDPAVQAANERRKQADAEYRELLHREMLKANPSLKTLLDKITELKKHDDF